MSEAAHYAGYPDRCVTGTAPSLLEVDEMYGADTAHTWLAAQLSHLAEYCGVNGKLTPWQVELCATNMVQEHGHLKVTEFLLYFCRMAMGRYGKFYGQMDPQRIMSWLDDFLKERSEIITAVAEKEEREAREREDAEHKKKCVTYDEYLKMKAEGKIDSAGYPRSVIKN